MNPQRLLLLFPLVAGLATAPAEAQSPPPAAASALPAAASPGPTATIDPAQTARARAEFDAWRSGAIDRSHYDAALNAKISDGNVAEMASALRTLGPIASFSQLQRGAENSGSAYYIYKVVGGTPPPLAMYISFDASGKIDGIAFRPMVPPTPPPPTPGS
ncbi:MAG: hypothetical protein ABSD03_08920 [Vulcanimicrobiaceae bacterium]|jgi:hypothetical protein